MDEREADLRMAAAGGDPAAAFELGGLLADREDFEGALAAWRQAAEAGDPDAHVNVGMVLAYDLDRPKDAFAHFLAASEHGDPYATYEVGMLLSDEGLHEDALEALQRAADLGYEDAWKRIGWELGCLGRMEEAAEAFERARQIEGFDYYDVLGRTYSDLGRLEEAEAVFEEGMEHGHDDVLVNYGDVLVWWGDRQEEAEAMFRQAIEQGDPRGHLRLGQLLVDLGRMVEAERELKLAVEKGETEAIAPLADLYERIAMPTEAERVRNSRTVRHDLGSAGVEHVRSQLATGSKRLGALLAEHRLEDGKSFAYVPPESDEEERMALDRPGLAAHDSVWEAPVGELIGSLLEKLAPGRGLLVFEDPRALRSNEWLESRPDLNLFFCGDDVYSFQAHGATREDIRKVLIEALGYPTIGMVTTLPDDLPELADRQQVEPEQLAAMAAAARMIAVAAWDAHGLVLWQPRG